jgi:hypothetical protein
MRRLATIVCGWCGKDKSPEVKYRAIVYLILETIEMRYSRFFLVYGIRNRLIQVNASLLPDTFEPCV